MNQAQLVDAIIEQMADDKMARRASKVGIMTVLRALTTVVHAELYRGGEVTLPGIGKLKVTTTLPRIGRNPKTGETLDISAGRRVTFTPARIVKDVLVNQLKRSKKVIPI